MSDIILKPTDWNIQAAKYNVKPGDRLILQGDRAEIELHDLVGTLEAPIVLTALSPVLIKGVNPGGRVVQFINCKNVRITGDPAGDGSMNITITNGGQGVDFRDLSTGVEADHLTINVGYSGINAKTDPTCDPKTWRGNFTLKGIHVHHNDITTKDGEGGYFGESHWNTVGSIQGGPCPSGAKTAQEHEIEDVIIEDNIFRSTGADAIQVGSCPTGAIIRRNNIFKYGTKGTWGQTAGIICNPGTVAQVYENWIDTGTGFAIQLQGPGGSVVRNNVILNAGSADQGGGIMQVNYIPNGKVDQIYNNTFVNIVRAGVEYYNNLEWRDNIMMVKDSSLLTKKGGSLGKLIESGKNIWLSGDPAQLQLDANYVPMVGSPAYLPESSADIGALTAVRAPKVITESGTLELVTTGDVVEVFAVTAGGNRIRLN